MTADTASNIKELDGFALGDYCRVKSGNFKGFIVIITHLGVAQYVNMKKPKAYALVNFPGGNSWTFRLKNLQKIGA